VDAGDRSRDCRRSADRRPDQARFRDLFKEMVETNTSLSGSCTALAEKIAGHLKTAGYRASDIHLFSAPDLPKEGGIVAVLPGANPRLKAILLLGHLDVVEARRADWTRDPYQFIEEGGFFYGRGTADMKSQVAAWVDTMMRLKAGEVREPAHDQDGADLRRRNQHCVQRRQMAVPESARPHRR
jgi:acetylornithine deacetylase/succinyl-diaminopimelate desuccinylase-like protein